MINTDLKGNLSFLNNKPVVLGFSGGKDSLATALYLEDLNIKFQPVFLDTGWEHEDTIKYINTYCKKRFTNLITLRNEKFFDPNSEFEGGFEQVVMYHKIFPFGKIKFCTHRLKLDPLIAYLNEVRFKYGEIPVNVTGVRALESVKRSKLKEIDYKDEAINWRPLIDWSESQVIDFINSKGATVNPQYISGANRVGCNPCIYERKERIRYWAHTQPEKVEQIRKLEKAVQELPANKEKGRFPTFFYRGSPGKNMTIDEAIDWSHTNSYEDYQEQEEQGCIKWGLCEPVQYDLFKDFKGLKND